MKQAKRSPKGLAQSSCSENSSYHFFSYSWSVLWSQEPPMQYSSHSFSNFFIEHLFCARQPQQGEKQGKGAPAGGAWPHPKEPEVLAQPPPPC